MAYDFTDIELYKTFEGKTIKSVELSDEGDEGLTFTMEDGTFITIAFSNPYGEIAVNSKMDDFYSRQN